MKTLKTLLAAGLTIFGLLKFIGCGNGPKVEANVPTDTTTQVAKIYAPSWAKTVERIDRNKEGYNIFVEYTDSSDNLHSLKYYIESPGYTKDIVVILHEDTLNQRKGTLTQNKPGPKYLKEEARDTLIKIEDENANADKYTKSTKTQDTLKYGQKVSIKEFAENILFINSEQQNSFLQHLNTKYGDSIPTDSLLREMKALWNPFKK